MTSLSFPPTFFVSGTDTDVGKTVVSALVTLGLGARYWKPVQSGTLEGWDRERVQAWTGLPDDHFRPETYALREPLSPHAAAALDGVRIDLDAFVLPPSDGRPLVVEGAGGLLVPLNEEALVIDLIDRLQLPVLLVARSGLGTINHTLLSLAALRSRQLPILGVVLNGPRHPGNRAAIETYGQVSVLAELELLAEITPQTLGQTWQRLFPA